MTKDQIEKFLEKDFLDKATVKVSFKTRKPFIGIFIKTADYSELKSKNFWRIVPESNVESYKKSKDFKFAKIYNGAEMTKLSHP